MDVDVLEGELLSAGEVATTGMDALTRSEIDMQVATAKRYPRSVALVARKIMDMATLSEETAQQCFYALERKKDGGGKTYIYGPSIRLAEIAMSQYGNLRAGQRSLGETEDGKFVRELGFCWDIETNVMIAREVKRRITGKNGRRYGDDMVGVTMAAAGAIALRNAVLTVVPRAIIDPAYKKAMLVARGDAKSLGEHRHKILTRLRSLSSSITEERVLSTLCKRTVDEIGWSEIDILTGLGTAIKDGVQSVEEAFPEPSAEPIRVADLVSPTVAPVVTPDTARSPAQDPATQEREPGEDDDEPGLFDIPA